ncbi:MAG: AAA family ATPase [Candidatus Saccharimonadales bacterium]
MAEDSGCISGKNYFLRDLRFELLNNLFLFPYNINPVITTEMEIITNGRSSSLAGLTRRLSNFLWDNMLMSKLIIIRGNSGSGKSTIAKELQKKLRLHFSKKADRGTMLIPQDVVRREILRTKDGPRNPSIQLIKDLAIYGRSIDYDVIIEGILVRKSYGMMLNELVALFDKVYIYYLDISFEETLRRHETKPNSREFGEDLMREWYTEKDVLGLVNEKVFTDEQTKDQILHTILEDLQ